LINELDIFSSCIVMQDFSLTSKQEKSVMTLLVTTIIYLPFELDGDESASEPPLVVQDVSASFTASK